MFTFLKRIQGRAVGCSGVGGEGRSLVYFSQNGEGTRFFHVNALGSVGFATRPTGIHIEAMLYYPYGETWQDTTGAIWDERFAGMMIRDADFDQYATPNRQNSPSLGRWMTPDPMGMAAADPANPQTWNMYAYVRNNPVTFNDPSGLYKCEGNMQQCQKFKKALAEVQKADLGFKKGTFERKRLDKVLSFYGTDNGKGPAITFKDLSTEGAVGVTQTVNGKTTITFDPKALEGFREAGQGETVAHEGTHGMDANRPEAGAGLFWTAYDKEYRAYQSESYVDMGLDVRTESDGSRPGWAPGMSYMQHVLNVTRNAYANALQDCQGVAGCGP